MGCVCPCLRSPITVNPSPNKIDSFRPLPMSLRSVAESGGSVTLKDSIDGSKQLNNYSARNSLMIATFRSSRKLEIVSKENSPSCKKSHHAMLRDVMYPDVNCTLSVRVLPRQSTNTASKSASNSNSFLLGTSQSMRVIRIEQPPLDPTTTNGGDKFVPESPPKAQLRSFRHLRIEQLDSIQAPNIKLNKPSQFSPLRKPSESRVDQTTTPSFIRYQKAQTTGASHTFESANKKTQPKPQRILDSPRSVRLVRRPLSPNKNPPTDTKAQGDHLKTRSRSPRRDSHKSILREHRSPELAGSCIKSKMSRQSPPQKAPKNSETYWADSMSARVRAIQPSEEDLAVLPAHNGIGQSYPSYQQSTLFPTTTVLSQDPPSLGTRSHGPQLEVATRGDCLNRSNTLCKPELSKLDLGQSLRKTQTCVYNRPEELSFCAISEKSGENSDVLIPNFDPDLDEALRI